MHVSIRSLLLSVLLLLGSGLVLGHGGGLDQYGCHRQTSDNTYHCHSGPLDGQSFADQDAMLVVLNGQGGSGGGTSTPDPQAPYDRDDYLTSWLDVDGDCINTRHEVLIIESLLPVTMDEDGCSVVAGLWYDPYTDQLFSDPGDLDIDHLVPLSEAHKSGGYAWSSQQKREFANYMADPNALIAVSASANRSKGDKDPDAWLPPNTAYHCEYVRQWESIKNRFGLAMDENEQATVEAILGDRDTTLPEWRDGIRLGQASGAAEHAHFTITMARAGGCGLTRSLPVQERIDLTGYVRPSPEHLGQQAHLYVVVDVGGGRFLMLTGTRGFQPWDGNMNRLEPYVENERLRDEVGVRIFNAARAPAGTYRLYLGYRTVAGDFEYMPRPTVLSIQP